MVGHHHREFLPLEPFPAHFGDAFLVAGQRARGSAAERADGLGLDRGKLAVEELAADLHFVRFGCTIARRAALHHVADVDLTAQQRDAFLLRRPLDHLCEQLACLADERDSLCVFIGAGTFADEHERRRLVAHAEYDLVAPFVQAAAAAIADICDDLEQGIARRGEGRKLHSRLGRRLRRRGTHSRLALELGRCFLDPRLLALDPRPPVHGGEPEVSVILEIAAEIFGAHWAAWRASRSFSASSKMRSAIARLDARGSAMVSPVRRASTTSFSSLSKPVSLPPTRLPTTMSQFLVSSLRRDSCCRFCVSAAKPISR